MSMCPTCGAIAFGVILNCGHGSQGHSGIWTRQTAKPETVDRPLPAPNPISLCKDGCCCMTHTVDGRCGKCGTDKSQKDLHAA